MIVGSIEWFAEKAGYGKKIEFRQHVETLREAFLEQFSPERLSEMDGAALLNKVFDNTPDTMMHLLMKDDAYRTGFGASSTYPYMSIVYKGSDGIWTLFQNNKHIKLERSDAEVKAVEIRDSIIKCVNIIAESDLNTVEDYKILEKRLSNAWPYYGFVTILKYFQMVFPYYFPGMYSDFTLARCIQILGLKYVGKSSNKRIQNMGIISIFIRNCGIHNTVFSSIYADEWGWTENRETCPAAPENVRIISFKGSLDKEMYAVEGNKPVIAMKHSAVEEKYVFFKMIDADKNVSIVRNVDDDKDYVQKEYKLFNQKIFERLKAASIKGIPRIYECEKVDNKLVTIEEYIKGRNLSEIIAEEGTFDEERMLEIALQLCDILESLHSLNPPMIHRDVKPSNIMMKKNGEIILIDFNASREYREGYTQDTVLFGTQNFAAPEQLMGFGDSDARTDIFGLGATLSYLMTNMPINQMVAPGKYSEILSKCIRMDKKDRYQNIRELREALVNA